MIEVDQPVHSHSWIKLPRSKKRVGTGHQRVQHRITPSPGLISQNAGSVRDGYGLLPLQAERLSKTRFGRSVQGVRNTRESKQIVRRSYVHLRLATNVSGLLQRLKLKALHRFTSTATAVEDLTAVQDGKLGKGLKKFLSEEVVDKGKGKESLVVIDPRLGMWNNHISPCVLIYLPAHSISKKLGIKVSGLSPDDHSDLWRGIRAQITALLDGLDPKDLATMSLGLSHSLSR